MSILILTICVSPNSLSESATTSPFVCIMFVVCQLYSLILKAHCCINFSNPPSISIPGVHLFQVN